MQASEPIDKPNCYSKVTESGRLQQLVDAGKGEECNPMHHAWLVFKSRVDGADLGHSEDPQTGVAMVYSSDHWSSLQWFPSQWSNYALE